MTADRRRWLGWLLAVAFACCLLMGPGPGVMLVNRPVPVLGLPVVYVWGLFWYAMEVTVILCAYFFVWHDPDSDTRR